MLSDCFEITSFNFSPDEWQKLRMRVTKPKEYQISYYNEFNCDDSFCDREGNSEKSIYIWNSTIITFY